MSNRTFSFEGSEFPLGHLGGLRVIVPAKDPVGSGGYSPWLRLVRTSTASGGMRTYISSSPKGISLPTEKNAHFARCATVARSSCLTSFGTAWAGRRTLEKTVRALPTTFSTVKQMTFLTLCIFGSVRWTGSTGWTAFFTSSALTSGQTFWLDTATRPSSSPGLYTEFARLNVKWPHPVRDEAIVRENPYDHISRYPCGRHIPNLASDVPVKYATIVKVSTHV